MRESPAILGWGIRCTVNKIGTGRFVVDMNHMSRVLGPIAGFNNVASLLSPWHGPQPCEIHTVSGQIHYNLYITIYMGMLSHGGRQPCALGVEKLGLHICISAEET
jgi:hypothetical protein